MALFQPKDIPALNEYTVQNALKNEYFNGNKYIVANTYLYKWESDFLKVTKSDYITEFEIKISRSDFRADFKKDVKHKIITQGSITQFDLFGEHYKRTVTEDGIKKIRDNERESKIIHYNRPNYFFYACPENLIEVSEVPDYAGLIYICKNHYHSRKIIKQAPKLHKNKMTKQQEIKLLTSAYYKYLKHRFE